MSSLPQIELLVSGSEALKSGTVRTLRARTTIAEAVFVPAPDLPSALVAIVEPFPGKFMVGYRSDVYSQDDAAEVARLVIGPFMDVTSEVAE